MLQHRQVAEREPISDLVQAMVQLQALQPPKPDTSVDTILKCIEIGKSLGGSGGGTDWGDIIKDVIKEVGPSIAPLIMSASRGGAPGPNAGALPEGEQKAVIEQQLMKQGIDYLKKKCMMRSDPGLYLDMIIDNAEEFPYSRLVHLATTQEFSAFAAVDADLSNEPYQTFFKLIYDGLRSHFGKPNSVEHDSAGASGDEDHVAGHGRTGTEGRG